jgi:hypothetical protein
MHHLPHCRAQSHGPLGRWGARFGGSEAGGGRRQADRRNHGAHEEGAGKLAKAAGLGLAAGARHRPGPYTSKSKRTTRVETTTDALLELIATSPRGQAQVAKGVIAIPRSETSPRTEKPSPSRLDGIILSSRRAGIPRPLLRRTSCDDVEGLRSLLALVFQRIPRGRFGPAKPFAGGGVDGLTLRFGA